MSIIKSNKLNILADKLFDSVMNNDFFNTKEILISSRKMESFLKSYFLKRNDGILMDVKFDTLNNGLLSLFNTTKKIASTNEMVLAIINYLSNNKVEELYDYLNDNNNTLRGIKIYDVSSSLARLYIDYENDNRINELIDYKKTIYDNMIMYLNDNNLDTLYHIFKTNTFTINKDFSIFGIAKYTKLEEEIINKYKEKNNIDEYILEIDSLCYNNKIDIIRVPSKLREIEVLHSKICDLILNENVKYSDILVVANNLSEYETTISRVFNQDNVDYPNIPYFVNASKAKSNEVLNGLRRLKNILDKGYFTRLDFINLAQNKVVQRIREITDEDVSNFTDTIVAINTFRGIGKNTDGFRIDDWVYARNRLLLSKITDSSGDDNLDKLTIDDRDYLPYTKIGMDNDSIVKFISLMDDIVNIMNVYNGITTITKDNAIIFKEALDRFFSIKEDDEIEINGYYKKASLMLDMIISNDLKNININTILYLLISCAESSSRNRGELYSSGISFTTFDPNTILSAKYVFFLNADSKNLPLTKNKNTFAPKDELVDYEDEENAFNLYYQNAEHFYISYIYKDLKTGEDYYLSNFVKDLFKKQNIDIEEDKIKTISIDETREWNELYTKKEFKNKDFRNGLLKRNNGDNNEEEKIDYINVIDTTITTGQIAKYLNEPLEYKANRLFGYADKTNENLKDEFEIFSLNNLEYHTLFKRLIEILNDNHEIDLNNIKEEDLEKIDNIREIFNLRKELPNLSEYYNESSFCELVDGARFFFDYLNSLDAPIEYLKLNDLNLESNNTEWTLSNNNKFFRLIGNYRTYLLPKDITTLSKKDMLELYAISLMDIVSLNDDNEYSIRIIAGYDPKKETIEDEKYTITRKEAIELLNKIYEDMNNYSYNYLFPYKSIERKLAKNLDELISKIYDPQSGVWSYFSDKKLFDYEKQLGYTYDNFKNEYDAIRSKQVKLFKFLEEKGGDSNED